MVITCIMNAVLQYEPNNQLVIEYQKTLRRYIRKGDYIYILYDIQATYAISIPPCDIMFYPNAFFFISFYPDALYCILLYCIVLYKF